MSQTKEIKDSVLKIDEKNNSQRRAKLAGIVRGCGSIGVAKGGINLTILTENLNLAKKCQSLIMQLYAIETRQNMQQNNLHSIAYEIVIPTEYAKSVLCDILVLDSQGGYILDFTVCKDFENDNFVANFACGVFLACGSVYLPDEKNSGYHLEFVFSNEQAAENFAHILAELNFMPKKVARKSSFVVYLKESQSISDFFARMGASSVVLRMQSIMIDREMNNLVNRQSNCITANIDKTVEAAIVQRQAIDIIDRCVGIVSLNDTLYEAAQLRISNEEDSLSELAEKSGISKSALNHRFRKIISIANELGGK